MSCLFSTNIAEQISCSQDGEFDDYGCPVNPCPLFPCAKYKQLVQEIETKGSEESEIELGG